MTAYAAINRVRTETRTAFCPVCRTRLSITDGYQFHVRENTDSCGRVECAVALEDTWAPLYTQGEDATLQAAQDALLTARKEQ